MTIYKDFKRSWYASAYSFGFLPSGSGSSLCRPFSSNSSFDAFVHVYLSSFLLFHSHSSDLSPCSDTSTLGTLIIEALAYHKPVHFINLQIAQIQLRAL